MNFNCHDFTFDNLKYFFIVGFVYGRRTARIRECARVGSPSAAACGDGAVRPLRALQDASWGSGSVTIHSLLIAPRCDAR